MAVKIGSARHDENGKYTGGKPGDQTGSEVSTQNWYKHSKGWVLLRAKTPEAREKIAWCMEQACANKHIGYDQHDRNTLYTAAKEYGFDVSKVTKDVETDCSALVRVCVNYADIEVGNFTTSNEANTLMKTGAFDKFTDDLHCKHDTNLLRGDILVTKTQAHTIVVLSNGSRAAEEAPLELGDRILKKGMAGSDIKQLQELLVELEYSVGSSGVDGDFGSATEKAVKAFQKTSKLEIDGEVGPKTIAALKAATDKPIPPEPVPEMRQVEIINGNCYVRKEPNTSGAKLGVVHSKERYSFLGQISTEGWYQIEFKKQIGWVSGKYSKLV